MVTRKILNFARNNQIIEVLWHLVLNRRAILVISL